MATLQLTREHLQAIEGPGVVALGLGAPQPTPNAGPVALGQVIGDVALLVADASARPARARRARRAPPS